MLDSLSCQPCLLELLE
jgi:hypothetical protein